MTAPCRSDCPTGDCAGCAFPPLTRCVPERPCSQSAECARTFPRHCNHADPIDASGLRHSGGAWCPMFIDARGVALEVAA